MKNLLSFFSLFIFSFLITGCSWFRPVGSSAAAVAEKPAGFALDDRLQRIKMSDLNGRPFTLEDLGGRPVFLNFWATWCGPCISEMKSIEEAYQDYKGEVVFLAVSNEDPEKIEAFREKNPFSFQFARLEVDYLHAFVIKLPTTMLISREGKLIHEEEGYRVWTKYNNIEKIKEIAE